MDANPSPAEVTTKLVELLFTFLGGLATLVDRLNKQLSRIKTVYAQVGSLGWPYIVLATLPARLFWWGLLLVSLTSAYVMLQGILIVSHRQPLFGLPNGLALAHPLLGTAALLALFVYFEIWTRVGLVILRRFGQSRFHPGCINAGWQVGETGGIKAMNVSPTNCEALGIAILDCVSAQKDPPGEMAPALPRGTDRSVIANYVFFGCVIEHFVHQLHLPPQSLNGMWRYLAWAATATEQPLNPSRVVEYGATQRGRYFAALQAVGDSHTGERKGELPVVAQIAEAVNQAAAWLASNYAGSARELAKSVLRPTPSPNVVWENLASAEPFRSSIDLRSLFLKLAMRMQVWPEMRPGAFLFPYYAGLPVLFLNAGCLVVSQDVQRIDPDEGWRSLVAATEEKIIEGAYRQFQIQSTGQRIIDLSHRFFHCDPANVDKWSFTDFLDLWLFDHTRNWCKVQSAAETPTPCSLKREGNECFCVGRPGRWYRDRVSFLWKA
jgi:hypothetical protein